jgi:hypothetical protein
MLSQRPYPTPGAWSPLGMSNTDAMKHETTTTHNCEVRNTKIGPCATRALPRLENVALKVVKMGT